eukprot:TRINITY_DN434_c0_g1_i4.p1 TRINITY_DN434_c0_g1~~TRINITY_DN434_c0_g1_i4.p1  ORF type:complete len:105 (-),score=17.06 TRINITY_DN434_c0_g1_i4:406-720(-)
MNHRLVEALFHKTQTLVIQGKRGLAYKPSIRFGRSKYDAFNGSAGGAVNHADLWRISPSFKPTTSSTYRLPLSPEEVALAEDGGMNKFGEWRKIKPISLKHQYR